MQPAPFESIINDFRRGWTFCHPQVVVAGEVAFTRSRDALSVTRRAGGEATQLAGHRITVYRKQLDGRWLLARDAHSLSPVEDLRS